MRNKYLIIFILISQIYQYLINNQQISFLLGKRFSNLILSKKTKSPKNCTVYYFLAFLQETIIYIYMFQHFNYSTFAPYLLISLQFLFLHLSTSLSFCPFPLKLSHRSVRLPSNFRQIRGRMAQSFTSVMPYPDGQRGFEFTVQCDFHRTATNAACRAVRRRACVLVRVREDGRKYAAA